MSDDAFLAAIRAAPHDDVGRLVYADYLDERGDARGEYLRLSVALRNPDYPGRGADCARLDDLDGVVDWEWVWRAFPVPKLSITGYAPAVVPAAEPVTKFGGQPVWLTRPEWPVSRGWPGRRMQFVCQVAIPDFLGVATARVAYLFLTHQAADERDHEGGGRWFFDPDTNAPDGGENAVVLQPGGDPLTVPFTDDATGPTLYTDDGNPCEFVPELTADVDPPFTPFDYIPGDSIRFFERTVGEKIGGTPTFGNGNDAEIDRMTVDPGWRLLLQLTTRFASPHYLNLGVNTGYVFVTADGKRGVFLTE